MEFFNMFDKVSHTQLLYKLHMYRRGSEICGWSRSILCSRTHRVVVDREASEMVQCQAARGVKNDYAQQSSVTQMLTGLQWQELAQMYKIVHNLILIEAMIYVKLHGNLISLQHILVNKKQYELSFIPHTVKDWNSLPNPLLSADSLKVFQGCGCQS